MGGPGSGRAKKISKPKTRGQEQLIKICVMLRSNLVSKKTNIDPSAISKIVRGKRQPTLNEAITFYNVFNIPITEWKVSI